MVRASIVIPAHNEATVIDGCLTHLLADAEPGEFEVIVAVNGSSDDTAARARAAGADVIELATPSKTAALRAADAHASVFPRIYLDADITLTTEAARLIVAALDTDVPRAAGARMVIDTTACSARARAYFRIWAQTDYRTAHMIGSGVYAVNAAGHARIADWPALIADDLFVQRSFTATERRIADAEFIARPPTTLRAQVRRATRWQRGNAELDRYGAAHPGRLHEPTTTGGSVRALLGRVLPQPRLWVDLAVYIAAYAAIRIRARFGRQPADTWERDDTSRLTTAGAEAAR